MEADILLNKAECIHTKEYIGERVVFNVCTGEQASIPWGVADWLGNSFGLLALIAFGLVLFALVTLNVR